MDGIGFTFNCGSRNCEPCGDRLYGMAYDADNAVDVLYEETPPGI